MTTEFPPTSSFTLASGHQLGFASYGRAGGVPVYYMHGFYGSRFEAKLAADAAEGCGIQLIAADRPGIGESAPEPGRSLRSWATNIAELADHLGHERFFLLGVSGGAPFALSCAHFLSARVQAVALSGGLAPLNDRQFNRRLPLKYQAIIWLRRHFKPSLKLISLPLYSGARRSPIKLLKKISRHLPGCDKNILFQSGIMETFVASLTEASKQGPRYGEEELTIFGSDWGFSLADITCPIDIWHGGCDEVVPVAMAHHFAENLQQSTLHILPDEGHFSLPIRQAEKIFSSLLAH